MTAWAEAKGGAKSVNPPRTLALIARKAGIRIYAIRERPVKEAKPKRRRVSRNLLRQIGREED